MDTHRAIAEVLGAREDGAVVTTTKAINRDDVCKLYSRLGFTRGAEVGVRKGRFAKKLLKHVDGLFLYLVDPYEAYTCFSSYTKEQQDAFYTEAKTVVGNYPHKFIVKDSIDAAKDIGDGELDFVNIDANHYFDWVMRDIIEWSYKVKSGGIIMCHDYTPIKNCGVIFAVHAYTQAHGIYPVYVIPEKKITAFWVKP